MKRSLLALVAALMVSSMSSVFAFGVGIQFNGNAAEVFEPGVALTFKVDDIPLVFAANWFAGESTSIGLTGDYWVLNPRLGSLGKMQINWFFGVGFFVNTVFADEFQINGGMRIPLGLNAYLAKGFFEPFIQIAPSFGLTFLPAFGLDNVFFPISAGFRMWFK